MANTLKIKRGTAATIPQGQLAEPLFTTDTYDLYIGKGSGGNQRIQNYIASGTSSQFLKGDGSLDSTTYQATSEKGQNNGYASLDSGGKVPAAQLPNSIMDYKGTWDASTNTPTLADGTGNAGDVYICSVGGTQNLGSGSITFAAGDWVVYSGSVWQKSINSNAVASVNGQTGAVVLYTDDISEDGTPVNLWFTNSRARLALSATSPVQYNNSTGVISILDASASQSGVVTTGTQTFAGAKTFSSDLTINSVTAGRGGGGESTSTAFGYQALYSNTYNATSNANTAIGYRALYSTVSASGEGGTNTAVGADTLYANTTGDNNTAIGVNAGRYLTTGSANTLIGMASFFLSTTGLGNTAVGYGAGQSNTSGDFNTYVGYAAAQNYTGGSNNTIIGRFAGTSTTLSGNVIIADGSGNVRFQHDGTNGKLPFLTSNGFVKTSNSDGTLSVDTNTYLTTSSASSTYLPLTGGTLTGPLSGTSATFSTEVTSSGSQGRFGGWITGAGYQGAALEVGVSGGSAVLIGYNRTTSVYIPVVIGGSTNQTTTIGGNTIVLQNNGVTALSIASTGAATFSGNVNITVADTPQLLLTHSNTSKTFLMAVDGSNAFFRANSTNNILFQYAGGTNALTISGSTGAATFSSSVTATQLNATTTVAGYAAILTNTNGASDSNGLLVKAGSTSTEYNVRFANQTDTATFFTIKGNGNVGIGTTSPSRTLHILGASGIGTVLKLEGAAGTTTYLQLAYNGATNAQSGYIGYDTSANMAFFTNDTERMRITSGGVLLAGISSTYDSLTRFRLHYATDSSYLDISSGNADAVLRLIGSNYGQIINTTGSLYISCASASGDIIFRTTASNTERMRITSGGNVSIGTGLAAANSFNFYQNYSNGQLGFDFYNSAGTIVFGFNGNSQTISLKGLSGVGNRAVYSDANGALTNSSSDITLKKNIENIIYGLDAVLSLKPVSYNWIPEKLGPQREIGFIAQEVQEIIPEVIGINSDETLSLDYPKLTAVLVKAIQEQQAQIEELKSKLN